MKFLPEAKYPEIYVSSEDELLRNDGLELYNTAHLVTSVHITLHDSYSVCQCTHSLL